MYQPVMIRTFAALLMLATVMASAEPQTHVVEMLNAAPDDPNNFNYFAPPLLRIDVGDTVLFKSVDPGHNSASKKGMIPDGTDAWNGAMDTDVEITFTTDGTYGYVCVPHYSMGMVGLILVGDYRVNYDQARKVRQRGKASKAFKQLFQQIDAEQ